MTRPALPKPNTPDRVRELLELAEKATIEPSLGYLLESSEALPVALRELQTLRAELEAAELERDNWKARYEFSVETANKNADGAIKIIVERDRYKAALERVRRLCDEWENADGAHQGSARAYLGDIAKEARR